MARGARLRGMEQEEDNGGNDLGGPGQGQGPNGPAIPGAESPDNGMITGLNGQDNLGVTGRSGETPRERAQGPPAVEVGLRNPSTEATPDRPSVPTPMAGSVSPGGPPQSDPAAMPTPSVSLRPFTPMGSPSVGSMATPRSQGLFGGPGGLTGGGLGVPLDPTNNSQSDPISTLIKLLTNKGGGGYI